MKSKFESKKVKNSSALIKIPENKLFISESGYAYHLDEIVDFIKGGRTFNHYKGANEERSGTLRDFKNNEDIPDEYRDSYLDRPEKSMAKQHRNDFPTHLFTVSDLMTLLKYPPFKEAFEQTKDFEDLQGLSQVLQENNTLDLMRIVAEKSQVLGNRLEGAADPRHLNHMLVTPLANLRENLNSLRLPIQIALEGKTSSEGPLSEYADLRTEPLIKDINETYQDKCGSGFNKAIAMMSNVFLSHHNYALAMAALQAQKQQSESKIQEVEEPYSFEKKNVFNNKNFDYSKLGLPNQENDGNNDDSKDLEDYKKEDKNTFFKYRTLTNFDTNEELEEFKKDDDEGLSKGS